MIRLATWGTLIEELALGTLIWVHEFRPYVMLSGIALHLVFECILNLRFFVYSNPLRERGIVFLSFSSDCKNPSLTLRVVINPNAFACFTNQRVRTRNFKTDAADYGEMSFFRPTTVSNHAKYHS